MRQPVTQCERTRELSSLELDGELSEHEAARLASHLEQCAACRRLEAEFTALTLALRAAPLEKLERPIALPRRARFGLRPFQVGSAAAAIAVAAGLATVAGTMHRQAPSQPRYIQGKSGPTDTMNALRTMRRAQLTPPAPFGRAGGHEGI
jgi:anti-sigma factor RsiW